MLSTDSKLPPSDLLQVQVDPPGEGPLLNHFSFNWNKDGEKTWEAEEASALITRPLTMNIVVTSLMTHLPAVHQHWLKHIASLVRRCWSLSNIHGQLVMGPQSYIIQGPYITVISSSPQEQEPQHNHMLIISTTSISLLHEEWRALFSPKTWCFLLTCLRCSIFISLPLVFSVWTMNTNTFSDDDDDEGHLPASWLMDKLGPHCCGYSETELSSNQSVISDK